MLQSSEWELSLNEWLLGGLDKVNTTDNAQDGTDKDSPPLSGERWGSIVVVVKHETTEEIIVFMDRLVEVTTSLLIPVGSVWVALCAGLEWGVDIAAVLDGERNFGELLYSRVLDGMERDAAAHRNVCWWCLFLPLNSMGVQNYHSWIGMKVLWDGRTVGDNWDSIDDGYGFGVLFLQLWDWVVLEDGSLLLAEDCGLEWLGAGEEEGGGPSSKGGGSQTLRQHFGIVYVEVEAVGREGESSGTYDDGVIF